MFVGETLEVLTIASRREESVRQAPAVAQVVNRSGFRYKGADTLAEVLEDVPGFFMADKEWGTQPFLRGIPDSILFLYDTVSLSSDMSKFFHPLDRDLSLSGIKRIEIIRGPGSVLWGPDAFAGIVNVVPMTGRDFSGIETGVLYGEPGTQKGVYTNVGYDAGPWNGFLSLSGHEGDENDLDRTVTDFWGDGREPVPPGDRYGLEAPGSSRYVEASGHFALEDWLTVTGRISDSRREYGMRSEEALSWCENRNDLSGILKIDARKKLDRVSLIRWTGALTRLDFEHQIIDRTLDQHETAAYTELIYDRSFWSGRGLLTGGVSYREKHVENAPIWDGYFPDYLKPENEFLLPIITEVDYSTRLWSLFGQYNHRIGDFDLWFGIRNDDHDEYEDHISYNTGLSWTPAPEWIIKLLYGTAYRTPFAKQLREDDIPELENIESLNLQIAWEPTRRWGGSISGFWNRIEDHVMEDPYAGLSLPNHQTLTGLELRAHYFPIPTLDLSANLTLIHNSGPKEEYRLLVDTYIDADGNLVKVFEEVSYPFNSGPDVIANLMATWKPSSRLTGYLKLGYTSQRHLIFPRGDRSVSTPDVLLVDMAATVENIWGKGLDLEFSVRNVLDRQYETPGTYSLIDGKPVSAQIILRKHW